MLAASPVLACDTCGDSAPVTNIGGNQNNSSSATANSSANAGATSLNLAPTQGQSQANNVSGVSNPIGQNQNIQINNQQTTSYGFGPGIQCQGASVAVSGYGGVSQVPGYTSSNAYGLNVALVTPVGGSAFKSCNALAAEITRQHSLDTCLTIFRAGYEIDQNVDPALFSRCSVLRKPVAVVVPPQPAPAPLTIVRTQVVEHRVYVPAPEVACANVSSAEIHGLVAREKYLVRHRLGVKSTRELTSIRHQLDAVCNQDMVSRLLDANGSQLP